MYPRKGHNRWFPEPGRPYEQFWRDGPRELFWRDGPRPRWDPYQPGQQWQHSQWEQNNHCNYPGNSENGGNQKGSFPYRGSTWRRPQGNFHPKSYNSGHFYKGPKSSFSKGSGVPKSSHSSNLINMTSDKKKSDSEKAKAPSEAPKEIKQEQADSEGLAKRNNPCQVRTKASKVVISAQDFNFRLPHDSLEYPQIKQEFLPKKPEEIKVEPATASLKGEDCQRQAPCVLAVTLSSSVTLENLRLIKEDDEIVPLQVEAAEGRSRQTASLPSSEVLSEKQELSQTTKNFHSVVKEEHLEVEVTKQDVTCPSVTNLASAVEPPAPLNGSDTIPSLRKKKASLKNLQAILKGSQTAEDLSNCSTPLTSVEAPVEQSAPFKIAKYFHSMEKEQPVQLQVAEDPPHQTASLQNSAAPIKKPGPAEIAKGLCSVKKEEPLLLEANLPRHNFNSTGLIEVPLLFDSTDDHQSEKNEETKLTQTPGSHKDEDQTSVKPLATGSSSILTTNSNVHSVPVLVRGKKIDPIDFWETPSLHAEHFGKWAPEDYQEPPQSVDKADKSNIKADRDLVPWQSSHCTQISCDNKSDTRRVLEGCSCLCKHCSSSDSRHSSTNRYPSELQVRRLPRWSRSPPRSPPRRGRSPPRRGRSPPRLRRDRSPSHRYRSPPHFPPRRCRSLSRSPLRQRRSPEHSSPQSPRKGDWSPPQLLPREDWCSPQSPPRQDCCHFKDLGSSRKPTHGRYKKRDFPSAHKVHHHHSSREKTKSYRVPHSHSLKRNTSGKKKTKITHTEEKRATSEKKRKPLKLKKKASETQALTSHDNLSSANEATIPPKVTENLQPVQVAAGSEHPDSPCQNARDETSSCAQLCTPSERSTFVLARKEEIEQAYQQVLLNFAAVAITLLETQPCMTEAIKAALQGTLRRFGNYYECKLKDFIDSFDLAKDS